ncbi:MAG: ATP-binding protein, partial [Rubrobacter sp.]
MTDRQDAQESVLPPGNLPLRASSFVGREGELAEVRGLQASSRLLTLTGPGGCGKTRLALETAAGLAGDFRDGVYWVDLSELSEPGLIAESVALFLGVLGGTGLSPEEALLDHLEHKDTLLVLDNCEHLIGACAGLADHLLRSCPGLRILATSREAFRIPGERAWLVPALSLPDPRSRQSPEEAARFEAVRLFVQRVAAVVPGFALTEENVSAVVRICERLDGIPLAIELAAARVRVLSPSQIASRLDDRFLLLTGGSRVGVPRQRTLRAAVDWSHELLSGRERVLFRRLSVFSGGFTLEAAEAVCSA